MRKENGRKSRIKNTSFPYKKHQDELKLEYLPEDVQKEV
jgi:hypothetical protein